MEKWELWLLIALVLGVVVSNLMVLKYTAKVKLPPFIGGKPLSPEQKATAERRRKEAEQWDDDSWDKDDWGQDAKPTQSSKPDTNTSTDEKSKD
ncbi:DUF2897 family protein [Ferrimonas marina]|uniref:DUF2897 family protein n=1 Tax=Ferrimonas marina TaxID=299255 RepID=A0A1M5RA83_9GAMM|nr:DUF2897 family protein [Ferrimonas marina]SHH23161.1 Protein of unknown function [Ferrimonas marina]